MPLSLYNNVFSFIKMNYDSIRIVMLTDANAALEDNNHKLVEPNNNPQPPPTDHVGY